MAAVAVEAEAATTTVADAAEPRFAGSPLSAPTTPPTCVHRGFVFAAQPTGVVGAFSYRVRGILCRMLKGSLIHPEILAALGRAGHGSRVLISDGNFPHVTALGPNADLVMLNLAPGMLGVTDVLKALVTAIPVEAAHVMATLKKGPYAMKTEPDIWADFRAVLKPTDCKGELGQIERFAFYEAARGPDVCLTIATGEQRIYANLLLTIGVRR